MGFVTPITNRHDGFAAMQVFNTLYGAGMTSKLFMNVREKLSLAYYCWSRLLSGKGIILVEGGIDTDKEQQVTDEVMLQLRDLVDGNTDPEVLESSKRALRERCTFVSPEGIMNWYSAQLLQAEILTPEDMINGIEKVTMDEVCAAADADNEDLSPLI
jgi:predicted Zn-dependent peptidase